jgi:hypothetical protein
VASPTRTTRSASGCAPRGWLARDRSVHSAALSPLSKSEFQTMTHGGALIRAREVRQGE